MATNLANNNLCSLYAYSISIEKIINIGLINYALHKANGDLNSPRLYLI
jgi:hypothetical protein